MMLRFRPKTEKTITDLIEWFEQGYLHRFSYEYVVRLVSALDKINPDEVKERINWIYHRFGESLRHSALILLQQKYGEMCEDAEEAERAERLDHARYLKEAMHRLNFRKAISV